MNEELKQLYQKVILDHSKHPRNFGAPERFTHSAEKNNPLCGDIIEVFLELDETNVISEAHFQGKSCAITTASASILTNLVKNKKPEEAEQLFSKLDDLIRQKNENTDACCSDELTVLSGVHQFPSRINCVKLPWQAMSEALDNKASGE